MRKVFAGCFCELGFAIKGARNRKIHIFSTVFTCSWAGLPIFWRKKHQDLGSAALAKKSLPFFVPLVPLQCREMERQGEDGHDRCPNLSQSSQVSHRVCGLESTLPICSSGCCSSSWGSFQWSRKGNVLRTLVHLLPSRRAWWEWPSPRNPQMPEGQGWGWCWVGTGWAMLEVKVGGESLYLELQMAIRAINCYYLQFNR